MSLYKQLWFAIACLMFIAFGGSFVLSTLSAKSYLEEQLYQKNVDAASSLALLLSNEAEDETMIRLFIQAQYDTGHYQFIRLIDGDAQVVEQRSADPVVDSVPQWFKRLFPIEVEPGVAQVSRGWAQVGTLSLNSQRHFAYQQLWKNSIQLFSYFLCLGIFSCLLGSRLLKRIIRPLHQLVLQAEAMGERQFITTKEPATREFRDVVVSMNKLSRHVQSMLEEESQKLELWRQRAQHDEISGLLNRQPALNHLDAFLAKEDENAQGSVVIIRMLELAELNRIEGREHLDTLIKQFGMILQRESESRRPAIAGRLNGSDFIFVSPLTEDGATLANDLMDHLERCTRKLDLDDVKLVASCTDYHSGESGSVVLRRLDMNLAKNFNSQQNRCHFVPADAGVSSDLSLDEWRTMLNEAFDDQRLSLAFFPVRDTEGQLLHWEAPARLGYTPETTLSAGHFMPYINRLEMNRDLDLRIVKLALTEVKENNRPISINLSAQLLREKSTIRRLVELIKSEPYCATFLWLEIPEHAAFANLDAFKLLCKQCKAMGCKFGIEHMAHEIQHIGELHDVGLDFIKIDHSLIKDIDSDTSRQILMQGLCTMIHSIGLIVIAEGVENENEWKMLCTLGIDGGTGRFFGAS